MSASASMNALVGSATRYLAGRNAVQTVYWRTKGTDGKMIRYNKTFTFEKSQDVPTQIKAPSDMKFKS